MPKWTIKLPDVVRIDVLLFDGFSNHCLANTLEPYRAANTIIGRHIYQWRLFSLPGGLVRSSSNMLVQTDPATADQPPCDFIMVTSGYRHKKLSTSENLSKLRALCSNARCVVGLDTGAWLLAAAGQLDGRKATIHSDVFDSFTETFAHIDARKDRYIIDRDRITCGGAMASFDLALHLIGHQCGEGVRLDVAALFLHETSQPFGDMEKESIRSKLVLRALVIMDQNIEDPLTIPDMADRLGSSVKNLHRRFVENLGTTPGKVYRYRRLVAVRSLVENTDLSMAEITTRCGYENASAMTRAFKQQFGITPVALRISSGN
ncbi:GlxA family transcriptional regulator [Loktanella sp. R86503]|uniref:GlxA family transcriptional regulator n=1 Tax=Loktanella sp. R86503 TaxID=3093847 RepID=UPI0036D9697E